MIDAPRTDRRPPSGTQRNGTTRVISRATTAFDCYNARRPICCNFAKRDDSSRPWARATTVRRGVAMQFLQRGAPVFAARDDEMSGHSHWSIAIAGRADVGDLLAMIRGLAQYEKLEHLVVADAAALADALFGPQPAAEAMIAREGGKNGPPAGFALFFPTFSTFLGRRGVWLEDLFVYPRFRGRGLGRRLIGEVAALARERGCG